MQESKMSCILAPTETKIQVDFSVSRCHATSKFLIKNFNVDTLSNFELQTWHQLFQATTLQQEIRDGHNEEGKRIRECPASPNNYADKKTKNDTDGRLNLT